MYINNLELENFRCFEKEKITFVHPGRDDAIPMKNMNLLLGNNGAGKTSILRAVALTILSRIILQTGFVPRNLVRRDPNNVEAICTLTANLELHAQDTESPGNEETGAAIKREGDFEHLFAKSNVKKSDPVWNNMFHNESPGFLIVGYGASRWVPTSQREIETRFHGKDPLPRYERVIGIFEAHTGLVPLGSWLPTLKTTDNGRFLEILSAINDLLPTGTKMTPESEDRHYCFEQGGTIVPFPELSDGYRAYIGWVADLLFHLQSVCPEDSKLCELKGIVLIDEVDLHLHPEWQREVLPIISEKLPNLQFIMSSHSPIVAGTLQASNISFLEDRHIYRLEEDIHGLSADQILLSSYFNLESTRAPGTQADLIELSERAMAGDEEASREYMKILTRGNAVKIHDTRAGS